LILLRQSRTARRGFTAMSLGQNKLRKLQRPS
jgi:hypothetical protein